MVNNDVIPSRLMSLACHNWDVIRAGTNVIAEMRGNARKIRWRKLARS